MKSGVNGLKGHGTEEALEMKIGARTMGLRDGKGGKERK
jgi:hypothetical protein